MSLLNSLTPDAIQGLLGQSNGPVSNPEANNITNIIDGVGVRIPTDQSQTQPTSLNGATTIPGQTQRPGSAPLTGTAAGWIGNVAPLAPATASTPSSSVDYSQLLPSSSSLQSFAPLSYSNFGQVPYVQASTVDPATVAPAAQTQAATVDPSTLPGALSQSEQSINQALQPTFQQQDQQLTADESSRGIYNSSAGQQLSNDLQGQQDSSLASQYAPLISQFAGYQQADEAQNAADQQSTGQFNATSLNDANSLAAQLQQQAGLSNQSAYNAANLQNADAYGNVTNQDMTQTNDYLASLYGLNNTNQSGLLSSVLTSYDPNAASAAGIFSNGLSNASQAYSNAYNAGSGTTAAFSNALGNAASSLLPTSTGGTATQVGNDPGQYDDANSSFGDF